MKSFNLKKDSWHFWLSKFMRERWYYPGDQVDLCQYIRKVIMGVIILFFVSFTGLLFSWAYLYGGYALIACLFDSQCTEPPELSVLFITINIIALVILAAFGACIAKEKYDEYRYDHPLPEVEKDPSFLQLAYRKFKDKTCVLINLE